ncbi:hypothetical protein [Enterobacter ludwigii]|uniref:hypothetical protein n=1 Tax=Enterobacter ludwigii TaxID=299767 RepID=UPI00288BC93B|nr:hypothetical protein [Enterobacter ludwigii]WNI74832.1 hypothetical protein RIK61_13260 [Enterobacter ludwigii]
MAKKTAVVQASTGKDHRGRFQAQGEKLEESEAWAVPIPPSTEEGVSMLLKLESKLEGREAKLRKDAFAEAKIFIQKSYIAGGVNAERKKTFMVRSTRRERVDVEILNGKAFKVVRNV